MASKLKPAILLVGHSGAGKTSLLEALNHQAHQLGCIDDDMHSFYQKKLRPPEQEGGGIYGCTTDPSVYKFRIRPEDLAVPAAADAAPGAGVGAGAAEGQTKAERTAAAEWHDTPGVDDAANRGEEFMRRIIQYVKQVRYVHQFWLVLNGTEPRFAPHVAELLHRFTMNFEQGWWRNVTLVFNKADNTHTSNVVEQRTVPQLLAKLKQDYQLNFDLNYIIVSAVPDFFKEERVQMQLQKGLRIAERAPPYDCERLEHKLQTLIICQHLNCEQHSSASVRLIVPDGYRYRKHWEERGSCSMGTGWSGPHIHTERSKDEKRVLAVSVSIATGGEVRHGFMGTGNRERSFYNAMWKVEVEQVPPHLA